MYRFSDARYPPLHRLLSVPEGAQVQSLIADADRRGTSDDIAGSISDLDQALAILNQTLGPDNPATLVVLQRQLIDLIQIGRYPDASIVVQRILNRWLAVFGPNSLEYASALEGEGDLLRATNDPASALARYQRAVAIARPYIRADPRIAQQAGVRGFYASALLGVAESYFALGDEDEAAQAIVPYADYRRAIGDVQMYDLAQRRLKSYLAQKQLIADSTSILSSAPFPYNPRVTGKIRDMTPADDAEMLAADQRLNRAEASKNYQDAAAAFHQLVAIIARSRGPNDPLVLRAALGYTIAGALAPSPDDLQLAEEDDARTRDIWGAESLEHAASLYAHGTLLLGHLHARGCELYREALAIVDRLKGDHYAGALDVLDAVALCEFMEDHPEQAERLYARDLAVRHQRFGDNDPAAAVTNARLGGVYAELGELAKAEAVLRQAQGATYARGQNSRDAAEVDYYLGNFYLATGRLTDAAPLLERSFRLRSDLDGLTNQATLDVVASLVDLDSREGLGARIQPLLQPVIAEARRTLGDAKASMLGRWQAAQILLQAYASAGMPDDADALIRDHPEIFDPASTTSPMATEMALEGAAFALQLGHPDAGCGALLRASAAAATAPAPTLSGLAAEALEAKCSLAQGRAGDAVRVAERSAEATQSIYGRDNPATAEAYALIAEAKLAAGDAAGALTAMRTSVEIERRLQPRLLARAASVTPEQALSRAGSDQGVAPEPRALFADFVAVASRAGAGGDAAQLGDEAFQAAQEAAISPSSKATLEAAARSAGSPRQAELARDYQDKVALLQSLDRRLSSALGAAADGDARAVRAEIDRQSLALAEAQRALAESFPAYDSLVHPRALTVAEVQQRLSPDAALVVILPAPGSGRHAGEARANQGFDPDALFVFVVTKAGLVWKRSDGARPRVQHAVETLLCQIDADDCGAPTVRGAADAFDLAAAHQIYEDALGFAEPSLTGVRKLYVAASGDLARLPLALLVTGDPRGLDLAHATWLADRFAITTLVSVQGFGAAPAGPQDSAPKPPFIGYGAPALQGGLTRNLRSAGIDGDWFTASAEAGVYLANAQKFRTLSPLPRTAGELMSLASITGAVEPAKAVHVGPEDDEGRFRTDPDLPRARVVAIATHGIFPRERTGIFEPSLVFTPPAAPTVQDDGLLTASEVLGLRITADWVILSACDTATAETDGDDLSSLSRAFLFAGAGSLLASHWRVDDDATAQLVTSTLRYYADGRGGLSKAQALQKAMQDVRSNPRFLHPRYWAPFSLISSSDN